MFTSKADLEAEGNVDEHSSFIECPDAGVGNNLHEVLEMQTLKCKADDLRSLASNFLPSKSRKSRLKLGE